MLVEVFSSDLEQNKHWYLLTKDICGVYPNKFCENDLFKVFTDEVRSIDIDKCFDENGGHIPMPKGKSNNTIHVGSSFAVIAGNLQRKDPLSSMFLRNASFQNICDAMNRLPLASSQSIHSGDGPHPSIPDRGSPISLLSTSSSSSGFLSLSSSLSEIDMSESRNEGHNLAPKKLAPILTSTPVVKNVENNGPYQKRKLREKAVCLMQKITDICKDQEESLDSVLARCCLIERRDSTNCKEFIQDVFMQVEQKLGVMETFEKLVPEELWQKRIAQMTVPDWQLLHLKQEVPIFDEKWQTILNRTHLGKGGVIFSFYFYLILKNNEKSGFDIGMILLKKYLNSALYSVTNQKEIKKFTYAD